MTICTFKFPLHMWVISILEYKGPIQNLVLWWNTKCIHTRTLWKLSFSRGDFLWEAKLCITRSTWESIIYFHIYYLFPYLFRSKCIIKRSCWSEFLAFDCIATWRIAASERQISAGKMSINLCLSFTLTRKT